MLELCRIYCIIEHYTYCALCNIIKLYNINIIITVIFKVLSLSIEKVKINNEHENNIRNHQYSNNFMLI